MRGRYLYAMLAVASLLLASACGGLATPVTVPPPGTDTSSPKVIVTVDIGQGEQDFTTNKDVFAYPPIGGFLISATAYDPGGVSKLELHDIKGVPNEAHPTVDKQVKGDPSNPVDRLFLIYEVRNNKSNEEHHFGIVAEDYSGNRTEIWPLLVHAKAVPSEIFVYNDPGTIIEIKGVLTIGGCEYDIHEPACHYRLIADKQFAELANTLGTDFYNGEFAPVQDGARDQSDHPNPPPAGWTSPPEFLTPRTYWPWDYFKPTFVGQPLDNQLIEVKDTFGKYLKAGDHIRMVGRLRYVNEDDVRDCWNSGATADAFRSRPQGHAEIHPIDLIEKIDPLPSSAETIARLDVCIGSENFGNLDRASDWDLAPLAPRPPGYVASVAEENDRAFTVDSSVKEHTLTRSADGGSVHVHVKVAMGYTPGSEYGKFRAKYRLWWSPPEQAVLQKDAP